MAMIVNETYFLETNKQYSKIKSDVKDLYENDSEHEKISKKHSKMDFYFAYIMRAKSI